MYALKREREQATVVDTNGNEALIWQASTTSTNTMSGGMIQPLNSISSWPSNSLIVTLIG